MAEFRIIDWDDESHKAAKMAALLEGVTLNQYIINAARSAALKTLTERNPALAALLERDRKKQKNNER